MILPLLPAIVSSLSVQVLERTGSSLSGIGSLERRQLFGIKKINTMRLVQKKISITGRRFFKRVLK